MQLSRAALDHAVAPQGGNGRPEKAAAVKDKAHAPHIFAVQTRLLPGLFAVEALRAHRLIERTRRLFRRLRGGAAASRGELRQFHEELYEAYRTELGGVNAMRKMKELWHYLSSLFIGADELAKKIARTKDVYKFNDYVSEALSNLPLRSGE